MTPKQRYLETMLFGNPDRIPLNPGEPRESTVMEWKLQGMPGDEYSIDVLLDAIGIDRKAALRFSKFDVSFRMMPEFEVRILEHQDGHYLLSDWMGAVTEISDMYDESYLREAKDFVTRKWHRFPVEQDDDWKEMKKRYDPLTPGRIGNITSDDHKISSLSFNGVFWQLREWCGFENLCVMMSDNPDLVHEMAGYWGDFVLQVLKQAIEVNVPERTLISEDMAFKAHSMISPAMTREFILPQYRKWVRELKKAGCGVIEIDSDGYIEELIPLWIEEGINCCSPIEVAAHCDIVKFRRMFGRKMAYMQGIDKRIMARGGRELEKHVAEIVPELFRDGGYIPGCDHGVPPDISWDNFMRFSEMLAAYSGWK